MCEVLTKCFFICKTSCRELFTFLHVLVSCRPPHTTHTHIWSIAVLFCVAIELTSCALHNSIVFSRWFKMKRFILQVINFIYLNVVSSWLDVYKNMLRGSLVCLCLMLIIFLTSWAFLLNSAFIYLVSIVWCKYFITTLYAFSSGTYSTGTYDILFYFHSYSDFFPVVI